MLQAFRNENRLVGTAKLSNRTVEMILWAMATTTLTCRVLLGTIRGVHCQAVISPLSKPSAKTWAGHTEASGRTARMAPQP